MSLRRSARSARTCTCPRRARTCGGFCLCLSSLTMTLLVTLASSGALTAHRDLPRHTHALHTATTGPLLSTSAARSLSPLSSQSSETPGLSLLPLRLAASPSTGASGSPRQFHQPGRGLVARRGAMRNGLLGLLGLGGGWLPGLFRGVSAAAAGRKPSEIEEVSRLNPAALCVLFLAPCSCLRAMCSLSRSLSATSMCLGFTACCLVRMIPRTPSAAGTEEGGMARRVSIPSRGLSKIRRVSTWLLLHARTIQSAALSIPEVLVQIGPLRTQHLQ